MITDNYSDILTAINEFSYTFQLDYSFYIMTYLTLLFYYSFLYNKN